MVKISIVIIARNEERNIEDCIRSAGDLADEILVILDKKTTDNTAEIAKKNNARVIKNKETGYTPNRNLGLKKANSDWILYIDADERLTDELKKEIGNLINSDPKFNAYAIPRKNIVLGKELIHGGFGKFDYVKRLFKKSALKGWSGEVHEEPIYLHNGKKTVGKKGEVGHLKNKMLHIKAQTLHEMVEKTNEWSEIEARLMLDSHHPPMNILRFVSAVFREFWFRFVKHTAFLDGPIGIIHGLYQVFSRFVSYAKLWELQQNARSNL